MIIFVLVCPEPIINHSPAINVLRIVSAVCSYAYDNNREEYMSNCRLLLLVYVVSENMNIRQNNKSLI